MPASLIGKTFGASIQESVYVEGLRKIADGIDAGLLDIKAVIVNDEVEKGCLKVELVLIERNTGEKV